MSLAVCCRGSVTEVSLSLSLSPSLALQCTPRPDQRVCCAVLCCAVPRGGKGGQQGQVRTWVWVVVRVKVRGCRWRTKKRGPHPFNPVSEQNKRSLFARSSEVLVRGRGPRAAISGVARRRAKDSRKGSKLLVAAWHLLRPMTPGPISQKGHQADRTGQARSPSSKSGLGSVPSTTPAAYCTGGCEQVR